MRGLAGDLVRRGWAVWNIEYRRLGDGGGWPATFEDVAAAIDHLRELDAPLDLEACPSSGTPPAGTSRCGRRPRRAAAGAPGRRRRRRVPTRVIGQAGVCDLAGAYALWRGGAVQGADGRLARASCPSATPSLTRCGYAPLEIPVLLVHGTADETVSVKPARRYAKRARDAPAAASS